MFSYCAVPYHISVRSTKPPKIKIHAQRPEMTRRTLADRAKTTYATERRRPDVEIVEYRKPGWKDSRNGAPLKYPEYLEKKHGKREISKSRNEFNRFLNVYWSH